MVLTGRVNREIVALLTAQGPKAIGISGTRWLMVLKQFL